MSSEQQKNNIKEKRENFLREINERIEEEKASNNSDLLIQNQNTMDRKQIWLDIKELIDNSKAEPTDMKKRMKDAVNRSVISDT